MAAASAQESLYRQATAENGGPLQRLARSYEADADKRRDLLQDIHLALWRSFETFDGRCSLRTWVYRIAHNVATTHAIRSKRLTDKTRSLNDVEDFPTASDNSPERSQTIERLYTMIARLNVIDHAVIVLYLEGEDAAAIAAVTGLSAANVATKIHRIKRLLAQKMSGEGAP